MNRKMDAVIGDIWIHDIDVCVTMKRTRMVSSDRPAARLKLGKQRL